jgi:hypothetical protein
MGTIPPLKSGSVEQKEYIVKGSQTFLLTIHKSSTNHILYLGGPHTYCISAQVYLPDSIYARFMDISEVLLDHLYYHHLCAVVGSFKRGIDTQLIFTLLFNYISQHYEHVKTVKLKDYSTRACDTGSSINLYEKYYITTGKTWYQQKYSAYLKEADLAVFTAKDLAFQELKSKITWNAMKQFISTKDVPKFTQQLFESSETWQKFFSALEREMGVSEFCSFISSWISAFLTSLLNYDFTAPYYYIALDTIPSVEYTIQKGGTLRRTAYTRKRRYISPKQYL